MEMTLRTIFMIILLLIATLVFAAIIMDWGGDAREWLRLTFEPLSDMILNR